MHILFTRFPLESTYGGAEVQTLSLMNGLRARGHDVAFLGSCPVLLKRTEELRMKNYELRIGDPPVTKWGAVSFLWRQCAMRKKLIGYFRPPLPNPPPKGEGNVICMLSLTEKLLLTDWAMQHGIRVFWIEHDRIGRWLRWNPWLQRLRRLSRLATTVVVSDLSKRMYMELGWDPARMTVIPNGIDTERFCPRDGSWPRRVTLRSETECRATNGRPAGHLTMTRWLHIGTIARLSPEKGVDLLIEAVKDLPNVHLTIVGTGHDQNHIHHIFDRINSGTQEPKNSVTLLPSVPDVAAFYRSLDLFVLPSRDHDPCPLAPIEAMACDVPVILTDACGTAGYLEHGNDALIVPANSKGALMEAILRLQSDVGLRHRLAARGPQVVAERFSMERMVGEYERVFNKNSPHT